MHANDSTRVAMKEHMSMILYSKRTTKVVTSSLKRPHKSQVCMKNRFGKYIICTVGRQRARGSKHLNVDVDLKGSL